MVPWARLESVFTYDFEEMTAYLAQSMDKTAVTKLMDINWRTVGAVVDRVVADRLDPKRFEGLHNIGIDEFSYRKRHRYLTVVVDHDRRRVVWATPGHSSATLGAFFDALGAEGIAQLENVTMDMAGGYLKAVTERAPGVRIIFDRFHVQRLMSDAVDEVRRALVRELAGTREAEAIKGSRYALLKNPWNLERREKQALAAVQRNNKSLYRAYLLKETLAAALDYRQPKRARRALNEWLAWAFRSRLEPVIKAARTIKAHAQGILAYVKSRLTNGIVEGFNNRTRMVARRAFGFHSPEPLIAMIYLCCGGIQLNPALP
jgi:transposase